MVAYKRYQQASYREATWPRYKPHSAFWLIRRGAIFLVNLRNRDLTIAKVAESFDMARRAVKKHLTVLSGGGLITVRASGRERINAFNPKGIAPVADWLKVFGVFWGDGLSTLKPLIENDMK